GYVVTAVGTAAEAHALAKSKLFPAAVVDLDTDVPAGGIELIRGLRQASPHTSIVLLSGRRAFEAAVDALRLGVLDVVLKRPDRVSHLKAAVERACDHYRSAGGDLSRESRSVLEDAFKVMLVMARKIYNDVSSASV